MTTTPPPMPETISSYYDEEEKRMYGMCSLMQVEARDAQWMERTQKLEAEIAALKPDAERMDWIAMHGSFGVDSGTGLAGGNGQKHVAATRSAIDAARAALKDTK